MTFDHIYFYNKSVLEDSYAVFVRRLNTTFPDTGWPHIFITCALIEMHIV
jgi:hypothetical protein